MAVDFAKNQKPVPLFTFQGINYIWIRYDTIYIKI
jgi:hypothetical protein